MKKIVLYVLAAMFLFAACKPAPQITFKETLEVPSAGGDVSIDVTANYAWTASSSNSWIQVTASGEKTLGLTIRENGNYDARTGSVTLTCEDVVKTLEVTQCQKDIIITDGDNVSIASDAQDIVIKVQGNVSYECQIEASASSWLHQVINKGLVSSQVTLHADQNPDNDSRSTTVVLQNTEKGIRKTFTVTQNGKPRIFKIIHNAMSFTVPTFAGTDFSAEVDWGDGNVEKYKTNAVHNYSTSKTYCITIKSNSPSVFTMSSLVGVESLDFSGM